MVTITGFEYIKDKDGKSKYKSYVESDDNLEYMDVTLNLDKSINHNEPFIYVKIKDDAMGQFNKNSMINDIIGSKEGPLKKRIEERSKNISLLEDEIKKEKEKFKKSIKDKTDEIKKTLEEQHKLHMQQLEYDLKKEQKIFDSMTGQLESIDKYRDKLIKEMNELRERWSKLSNK